MAGLFTEAADTGAAKKLPSNRVSGKIIRQQSGFTLVELIISLGIIAVLATLALTSYSRYSQRASISTGLALTAPLKLSAVQFSQPDLLKRILTICDETGIFPNKLELEITESTVMQNIDEAASTLRGLHCCGMRVSIDDFGSGYSSLHNLKRFPINSVKIDRTFVRDITSDPDDAAIVSAIISMSHNTGLKVIAEGVETRGQLDMLRELQCDEIQGFLFSPPVPQHQATLIQAESG